MGGFPFGGSLRGLCGPSGAREGDQRAHQAHHGAGQPVGDPDRALSGRGEGTGRRQVRCRACGGRSSVGPSWWRGRLGVVVRAPSGSKGRCVPWCCRRAWTRIVSWSSCAPPRLRAFRSGLTSCEVKKLHEVKSKLEDKLQVCGSLRNSTRHLLMSDFWDEHIRYKGRKRWRQGFCGQVPRAKAYLQDLLQALDPETRLDQACEHLYHSGIPAVTGSAKRNWLAVEAPRAMNSPVMCYFEGLQASKLGCRPLW